MMPVNVRRALRRWRRHNILIKTITETTVDFVPVRWVVGSRMRCMVQPTKQTMLNVNTLDWTKRHINLYSYHLIDIGKVIEHQGYDYKVVDNHPWEEYGFCRATCEQIKSDKLIEVDEYA